MDDWTDAQREAWGTYYDHASDELGYEPNAAWKYADRELRIAMRTGRP
jgi:hypothetical protein